VRRTGRPLALAALLLAFAAAPASAAHHKTLPPAVQQVLTYCAHHNSLTSQHYPLALLEETLSDLPSDLTEYTLCANEIRNAEAQDVGGSHPQPGVSAATRAQIAANAANALKKAQAAGGAPIDLGGEKIAAGAVSLPGSSFFNLLPTPILVVVVLLLALGSIPAALRIQRLVRSRRSR
jgi:hypothetical protein